METVVDELPAEEQASEETELLKEVRLLPPDDTVRAFEEYLMEIGIRF